MIQLKIMNHFLNKFFFLKQTANSLKARAFFIFSCLPHSTSMELGTLEVLIENSRWSEYWPWALGSSQTSNADWLDD